MADRSTLPVEHVPETSSKRMTETITGTFDFMVTNYTQLRGMAVGESISSRDFRVGGYDWRIMFYPSGQSADSSGCASSYVQLASRGKDATARFTLSVLERDGEAPVVSHAMEVEHVFCPDTSDALGYLQFVAKSKLKSLSRQGDGCFTIRCVLAVRNDFPPLDLLDHLEGMLQDGPGADITFLVDGREFRAHKCLLAARSPVFRAQLFGPMKEANMPRVQVIDMEAAIFEMMLHYIYTGSISPCSSDDEGGHDDDDVMQHLLVAADRYGLDKLKMICEEELCKRIDVGSVMSRFLLAKQRSCNRLKDTCINFMSSPQVLSVVLEKLNIKDMENLSIKDMENLSIKDN